MILNFKQKKELIIVFCLAISGLNSSINKSKAEKDLVEKYLSDEIIKTNKFPSELSEIMGSYAVPKYILLNFVIPNVNGKLILNYGKCVFTKEKIDKILEEYPKIERYSTINKGEIERSYNRMYIHDEVEMPIVPRMAIPLFKELEGLKIYFDHITINLKARNNQEDYNFKIMGGLRALTYLPGSPVWFLHGEFTIKLINDFKTECKDKFEAIVKSEYDPNVALCIRKIN